MIYLHWIAFIIIVITTITILNVKNWRWMLGFFAIQFAAICILSINIWPSSFIAVGKMATGWSACAILGMTILGLEDKETDHTLRLFQTRFLLNTMIVSLFLISYAFALGASIWLGINVPISWASLFLICTGLFHLSISSHPLRLTIAMLTSLSGFEIIYASVEQSIMVTAMLTAITLGFALAGSLFIDQGRKEAKQ